MKTIFKNKNWKPCLTLFFLYENKKINLFIHLLCHCTIVLHSLYKGNVLSVQGYHLWKIIIDYESFLYFSYHSRIMHICHALMEIPILSPIIIFGENFFDLKSSTIFSTKPLEIWLTLLYGHIT